MQQHIICYRNNIQALPPPAVPSQPSPWVQQGWTSFQLYSDNLLDWVNETEFLLNPGDVAVLVMRNDSRGESPWLGDGIIQPLIYNNKPTLQFTEQPMRCGLRCCLMVKNMSTNLAFLVTESMTLYSLLSQPEIGYKLCCLSSCLMTNGSLPPPPPPPPMEQPDDDDNHDDKSVQYVRIIE